MPSKQYQVALAFLDAFKDMDYETSVALRTPNCRHTFAPASLNMKEKTNEDFAAHVKNMQGVVGGIPVTPKQIFEGNNQVTIWATSETIFQEKVKASNPSLDWTYEGEYIFVLSFNEAGDKIQHILEFLDSKKVEEMRALLMEASKVTLG